MVRTSRWLKHPFFQIVAMGKWAKYAKTYNERWENEFPWVKQCPTDESKAYCTACRKEIRAHHNDLSVHASSQKHRLKSMQQVPSKGCKTLDGHVTVLSDKVKKHELAIACHIACHSSVRTVDHLGELINVIISSTATSASKPTDRLRLHRTKCSALIVHVIAPSLLEEIVQDCNNKYSLILDESTDVGTHKYMAVCIRFFCNRRKKIVTRFLGLVEIHSATAENLYNGLKDFIENKIKLKLENITGLGTDGASNMVGQNCSLFTKLREHNPDLVLIKCICHSLHLCMSAAAKVLPTNIEFLLRETYNWFSNSPLRREAYRQIYSLINSTGKEPKKILQLSGTRWLAREAAIDMILEQWLELKTHFKRAAQTERCFTANTLSMMYEDDVNYFFLTFLLPITKEFTRMSLLFQQTSVDPAKLFKDFESFVSTLFRRVVRGAEKLTTAQLLEIEMIEENFLDVTLADLGTNFRRMLINSKVPDEQKSELRKRCYDFLKKLCEEVKKRVPSHMKLLSTVVLLSPEHCLSQTRCSFDNLPLSLLVPVPDKNLRKVELIEDQWRRLLSIDWTLVVEKSESLNSEQFWVAVYNYTNAGGEYCFRELAASVLNILALPVSNAFVERVFSIMNCVKTKVRNRMGLKLLSAILLIRGCLHGDEKCCQNFIPSKAMFQRFDSSMYKCEKSNAETEDEDIAVFELLDEFFEE